MWKKFQDVPDEGAQCSWCPYLNKEADWCFENLISYANSHGFCIFAPDMERTTL